ncbi:E3 ubiquitin-protein ligase itt1 [Madurella mycetomatis]|uniref:RBR-type E3 ubiquitin transferase n=1 Tax=Madurella mycetomatis TaxID=100816 RepID=A0A175VSV6_9PEZI|nr:E3 ubiquitin-protein ligase itt1 [Madurella mycetomatis]KXX80922.1 E3 ubiquitin-protein ligase itt1 [Madurella mycetomatis]
MAEDEFNNPRDVELSSLSAIYPEIQQLRPDDPYTVALDIPVSPSKAVTVFFPAAADDALPPGANGASNGAGRGQQDAVDSHELAHLPSIRMEITLGPQYPAEKPPQIAISTTPPWLPEKTVKQLEDDAPRLWEEMGRDMVGFTYIDHVQQAAEDVFGLVDEKGTLEVDPRHKIAIIDYDIKARRAAFEKETFDCGVCLDPKKGSVCHRMLDCGHVFCVECLQDCYNNAIKEGDLAAVRCPAPNCAKERAEAASGSGKKRKKTRTFINPSELLQIPLDQEMVKRYVTLKYKTELESDKNTVYCPRPWCHGAARSKKHKKPQGLELAEASEESGSEDEDGDDHPDGEGKSKPYKPAAELLAICEECSFAFCSRCHQSWHGEFVRCTPRRDKEELTAEEQASLEYMKLHTTPCPTCAAPAQKTHGCNHMICYRCQSHFCYLCSAWLDPGNPYQHFNEMPGGRVTGCYMRLWELEMGDGNDVGYGFAGGAGGVAGHLAPAPVPVPADGLIPEIEEPEEEEQAQPAAAQPQDAHANGGQVGIAREGPLVLRIAANQPAGAGRGGPRARQAAAVQPAVAPLRAAARGGGGGGGGGARAARNQPMARGGGPLRGGRQGGVGAGGAAVGQRGRGRGGGGPPHRQNNNNPANQAQHAQRRNANNNNQNQDQDQDQNGGGGGGRADVDHLDEIGVDEELNPAHQAWVRHFVMLALNDEEDILFEEED